MGVPVLSSQMVLFFRGILLMGLDCISVSIDTIVPKKYAALTGTTPGHLQRVLSSVERLLTSSIKVKVGTVITKGQNEDTQELHELLSVFKQMGIEDIAVTEACPFPHVSSDHLFSLHELTSLSEIYEMTGAQFVSTTEAVPATAQSSARSLNCGLGRSVIFVSHELDVYPCPGIQEITLGNLANDSLETIWETSPGLQELREIAPAKLACANCPVVGLCKGGCRAKALAYFGTIEREDPMACCYYGQSSPSVTGVTEKERWKQ